MKTILIVGAGRSSSSLISYTIKEAHQHGWHVIVGDALEQAAQERVQNTTATAIRFNIQDETLSKAAIASADVVVSLLPAHLHPLVARHCLDQGKHLLTASYVSTEMKAFHDEANAKGLLLLNECGLDPGIDHMSAMQVIDTIRARGGQLTSFESFTGGLIAPETDPENPWRYKFTWNPRNVVMAGQGTAKFIQNGQLKFIPYQQLFKRITPVHVNGYGDYEGYANRDSLTYLDTYGLRGIQTMLRGTLRNKGYCSTWNVLVQLGCCDDTYALDNTSTMTHREFINSFLDYNVTKSVEEKLMNSFGLTSVSDEMKRLTWSGFFSTEIIGLPSGTPAQLLEHILNKKWKLNAHDKDLIVMWHRFMYSLNGTKKEIQATLVAKGDDSLNTAMAKTVGLPLAIAAKLLLQGKIQQRGVVIPVTREFYKPILDELKMLGVELIEKEMQ